jgi:hypothetical protein
MRFISIFLSIIAVFLALLVAGLIVYALAGGEFNVLLPGLGLILNIWAVIIALAAVAAVFIFLASIFKWLSPWTK